MVVKVRRKAATPKARSYHHGDLKNALLAAALELIAVNGARALSLREVARATGVSHASTYRHFPNKESVLAAIAERGFRELTQQMRRAALQSPRTPLQRLHRIGMAYVAFGRTHPHHIQIMFGDFINSHQIYPSLLEASRAAFEVLLSTVRAGQNAGLIRGTDERLVSFAAWSQVHGLALLIGSGHISTDDSVTLPSDEIAGAALNLLQAGLAVTRDDGSIAGKVARKRCP
jgi:AcrR family transcriptional regulator